MRFAITTSPSTPIDSLAHPRGSLLVVQDDGHGPSLPCIPRGAENDMDDLKPKTHQEAVAVFRHGILGALTQAQLDRGALHTALSQLLRALSTPDNTVRSQAEDQLNNDWVQNKPDILLMGLAEQIGGAEDTVVSADYLGGGKS